MKTDFSQPQRQSLVGVLVMFADTFQSAARALLPVIVLWLFRINETNRLYVIIAGSAVVVTVAIVAYLKYLNFSFFLDDENEEFVVSKGILNKSRIAIPLEKIQQVNINQSFIQKIIGVHALDVDTAGGSGKEVSIRAISHDLAVALKKRLSEGNRKIFLPDGQEMDSIQTMADEPFIEISLLSLLKTGITSNYTRSFALLLAFVITVYQYIEDFIQYADYNNDPLDEYLNAEVMLKSMAFIIVGIMVLTLIINLVRTIVRYFNYRITKQQNSLLLSHGLLSTRNTILRPEKVQIVTIGRNFFQKKLDINDLKIRQASGVEANDKDQKKTAIEVPGCNEQEKQSLLKFLLGSIPERGVALKPNIRKIIMDVLRFLVIPLAIFFLFAYYIYNALWEYVIFVPVYIIFACTMIYFAFRHSRLFINDEFIIKRSGAWDIDNDIIMPHKIQALSVTQYFWHKSSDIGIVTLHTAGGSLSFGLANFTKLRQLVNYWLYQVETTNKHWM